MTDWEKEIKKLDLHRALLRHDIDYMIVVAYNSFYLKQLEITLLALEYNIAIYRHHKPRYLKQVSHLILPLNETIF